MFLEATANCACLRITFCKSRQFLFTVLLLIALAGASAENIRRAQLFCGFRTSSEACFNPERSLTERSDAFVWLPKLSRCQEPHLVARPCELRGAEQYQGKLAGWRCHTLISHSVRGVTSTATKGAQREFDIVEWQMSNGLSDFCVA